MTDQFSLDGTAVVTGASKGIGRAVAERFAAEGANVAICARTEDEIEAAATEITETHAGEAVGAACDVRDSEGVEALVETATDRFGGVDALVNNAGASFVAGFEDISENGWQSVVGVNLTGTVNCTQAAAEHLKERNGAVVNVSSLAGVQGAPHMSHYGAAKAAIQNLTRSLAAEWAGDGVRVNCVAPGFVATPGVEAQMGISPGDVDRATVDRTVGTPEEVADVVHFLASDAASFVTGETLPAAGVPEIEHTPRT
jgi:NAD(P)-dependent dehydrogenase (short-subunit alcohol dehydrogenase family)